MEPDRDRRMPRFHGELLKFGIEISQATVAKFHNKQLFLKTQ